MAAVRWYYREQLRKINNLKKKVQGLHEDGKKEVEKIKHEARQKVRHLEKEVEQNLRGSGLEENGMVERYRRMISEVGHRSIEAIKRIGGQYLEAIRDIRHSQMREVQKAVDESKRAPPDSGKGQMKPEPDQDGAGEKQPRLHVSHTT